MTPQAKNIAPEVNSNPLLEFRQVAYQPANKPILSDLNLEIRTGEFLSIVGPSGSGKSTFLKLCCSLITPTAGEILYQQQLLGQWPPTELRKKLAYCAQTPILFGSTVRDNLLFPYTIRKLPFQEARANELLDLCHLDHAFLQREVEKLSGGEKQRLALIRTLLFPPEVLLLDEITSALDNANRIIVETLIQSLNKTGMTVLWVTHDLEQSRKYAHRRLTLEDGRITGLEVL